MRRRSPPFGLSRSPGSPLGAIGGAIAGLPAVSLARDLALWVGSVPALPGAERAAGDVKLATFAEIAAIVLVLPAFSFFFGRLFPRFLERRARPGRLSFQWAGAAAAISAWLSKDGVAPAMALSSGIAFGVLTAGFVLAFRNRIAVRRLFTRPHRWRLAAIAAAGSSWELARLSNPGGARPLSRHLIVDLAIAAALALGASFVLRRLCAGSREGWAAIPSACGISFILAAVAIVCPRTLPFALAASAGIFVAAPWIGFRDHPRAVGAAALLLLTAWGWTTYFQPYMAVNVFEDGCTLAFAHEHVSGAAPFRQTFPVHGWGVDGGVDGLAFRLTSPTLETFRIRRALFTALALPALAAACAATLGSAGWAAAAFTMCLGICPFVSERHLLAFAAVAFLAAGVRRERMRYLVPAGIVSAMGVFFALDMGIIVLAGGVLGLGLVAISRRRLAPLVRFLIGVVIGAIPFIGILAGHNSLRAFFRVSFREIPGEILATWGLPLPPLFPHPLNLTGIVDSLRGTPPTIAFLATLACLCVIVLLFRLPWDREDLVVLPALAVALLALRGAAGRADPGHYELYGVFAGIPAAWLLRRAAQPSVFRAAAVAAFLWMGIHPRSAMKDVLGAVKEGSRARARGAAEMKPIPGGGSALVPATQADDLAVLRKTLENVMGPRDTYFDFSNEPALYFLLDRRMPIPYLGPEFYESAAAQQRVVALCERVRPIVAIAQVSGGLDSFDGVANDVRAPLVEAYLKEKYRPFTVVGGRILLVRADRQDR